MVCTKCSTPLVFIRAMSEKWELWKCSDKNCGALHFVEAKPLPSESLCTSSTKQKGKSKKRRRRDAQQQRKRNDAKVPDLPHSDL